jgi:hypothetical protein
MDLHFHDLRHDGGRALSAIPIFAKLETNMPTGNGSLSSLVQIVDGAQSEGARQRDNRRSIEDPTDIRSRLPKQAGDLQKLLEHLHC